MIRSKNEKEKYDRLVRIAAGVVAIVFMGISSQFSADGFALSVPDRKWIGWVLAVGLIVIEIVWNKKGPRHGVTLYVAGLICYIYGIYTNIAGINYASNHVPVSILQFGQFLFLYPVNTAVGLILELLPEPLLIWALTGESTESDPVSNMMSMREGMTNVEERDIDQPWTPLRSDLRSRLPQRKV